MLCKNCESFNKHSSEETEYSFFEAIEILRSPTGKFNIFEYGDFFYAMERDGEEIVFKKQTSYNRGTSRLDGLPIHFIGLKFKKV